MPPLTPEKVLLTWEAPVRPFRPHSRQLLTTAGAIAGLVGLILVFAGEWMLIGVIAALAFAYYLWSTTPPQNTSYSITSLGIRAHDQLYRFEEITRWWLEDKWGQTLLVIDTPYRFPPRLHLLLHTLKPKSIEDILSQYVLMEKPKATPLDRAGVWLASKFPLE